MFVKHMEKTISINAFMISFEEKPKNAVPINIFKGF